MGSAASSNQHRLCPVCFNLDDEPEDLYSIGPSTASPPPYVHYRPSTIEAWLKHWEIGSLHGLLASFGLQSPTHVASMLPSHHARISAAFERDPPMARQWGKALQHLQHLRESTSAYDLLGPRSLRLWLESWRLGRHAEVLEREYNCRTRNDVLEVTDYAVETKLKMRPLEIRRWRRAQELLKDSASKEEVRVALAVWLCILVSALPLIIFSCDTSMYFLFFHVYPPV